MSATEQITDAELMQMALDARLTDLHVAMPGKVQSYNASSQTADVIPMLNRSLPDGQGDYVTEKLPALSAVPICFPRGGGFFASFPIAPGDYVLLVFSERSIGAWRATGSQGDPGDLGMHTLDGAIAIPGVFPGSSALSSASATNAVFGKDGVSTAQVETTSTGVNIGAGATQAMLKGDDFETAVNTMVTGLTTAFAAIATYAAAVAVVLPVTAPGNAILQPALLTAWPAVVTAYTTASALAKSLTSKVT